ncbi:MAG: hypothetical protein AAF548_17855 [Actinomycetota bacterium]
MTMTSARVRVLVIFLAALALVATACGDDGDDTTTDPASEPSSSDSGGDGAGAVDGDADADTDDGSDAGDEDEILDGVEDAVDDMVDGLEDLQESSGGGSATLTVGDQEWTFSSVLCAFGPEEIGQEGAEFVLSSLQDGLQMYVSIDSFGYSLSLDDISDFQNPSIGLSTFEDADITVDGKDVTASGDFLDTTSDDASFETTPGTFTATCP